MDNEATMVLNHDIEEKQSEPNVTNKKAGKLSDNMVKIGTSAAGAALGTGVALAGDRIYEYYSTQTEETAPEVEITELVGEESTSEDQLTEITEEQVGTNPTPVVEHIVVEHHVYVEDTPPMSQTMPANLAMDGGGDQEPEGVPVIASVPDETYEEDNEVQVVGMAIKDNGQGGLATIAGLQAGEEMAIVIDIETDGTIDVIGIDENRNGMLESNEWHDVSNRDIFTAQVVGEYIEDAHEHGELATVTDLDSGDRYVITEHENGYGLASMDENMSDNLYTASNDDMPDYMNDADTSFLDA